MKTKLLLSLILILNLSPSWADAIIPPPPFGFNPFNAAQSDFIAYNLPPAPIGDLNAMTAWNQAMNFFGVRAANVTTSPGPALGAVLGVGTCSHNGQVCNGPCTFVGHKSGANCISPAGTGSAACTAGGTYNSAGVCTSNSTGTPGAVCQLPNGSYSQYNSAGVCIVPGNTCTTGGSAPGVYNSSGACEAVGSSCSTTTGLAGTLNSSGTCVALNAPCTLNGQPGTTAPSGSCIPTQSTSAPTTTSPTTPNSGFANPHFFGTNTDVQYAGVSVSPTTPAQFTTSAMIIQFTVPTQVTSPDGKSDELSVWVASSPLNGSSIAQVAAFAQGPAYQWQFAYACNAIGGSTILHGIPINPGDTLFLEMWNTSPTQAYGYFANQTQQVSHVQSIACSANPWQGALYIFALENPLFPAQYIMPNFHTLNVSLTQVFSNPNPTSSVPSATSDQYVFEANGASIAPTYQTFSGTFVLNNMLQNPNTGGACCTVTTTLTGTGGMTFTRSQSLN